MNILEELKEFQRILQEDVDRQREIADQEVPGSPEYNMYEGKARGFLSALDILNALVKAAEQEKAVAPTEDLFTKAHDTVQAFKDRTAAEPNIGICRVAASRPGSVQLENAVFKAVWENVPGIDYRHAVAATEAVLAVIA